MWDNGARGGADGATVPAPRRLRSIGFLPSLFRLPSPSLT